MTGYMDGPRKVQDLRQPLETRTIDGRGWDVWTDADGVQHIEPNVIPQGGSNGSSDNIHG